MKRADAVMIRFEGVSIVFGDRPKRALPLMDQGLDRAEIEKRTGKEVSYGAVYTTLDRLERKGLVTFRLGEVTSERGGRAKKYFRVLPAGVDALRESRDALGVMWQGVQLQGGDGNGPRRL